MEKTKKDDNHVKFTIDYCAVCSDATLFMIDGNEYECTECGQTYDK